MICIDIQAHYGALKIDTTWVRLNLDDMGYGSYKPRPKIQLKCVMMGLIWNTIL